MLSRQGQSFKMVRGILYKMNLSSIMECASIMTQHGGLSLIIFLGKRHACPKRSVYPVNAAQNFASLCRKCLFLNMGQNAKTLPCKIL